MLLDVKMQQKNVFRGWNAQSNVWLMFLEAFEQ